MASWVKVWSILSATSAPGTRSPETRCSITCSTSVLAIYAPNYRDKGINLSILFQALEVFYQDVRAVAADAVQVHGQVGLDGLHVVDVPDVDQEPRGMGRLHQVRGDIGIMEHQGVGPGRPGQPRGVGGDPTIKTPVCRRGSSSFTAFTA